MNPINKKHAEYIESRSVRIPFSGCWIWDGATHKFGYGAMRCEGKNYIAHRFSYRAFKGDFPSDLHVCHKCDVPQCVNPDHLFVGTHKENHADKERKMRGPYGEKSGNAKLTCQQVKEIRESTEKQNVLAKRYGVGTTQINRIVNFKARLKG